MLRSLTLFSLICGLCISLESKGERVFKLIESWFEERRNHLYVVLFRFSGHEGLQLIGITVATDETDGFKRFMRSADLFNVKVKVYFWGFFWGLLISKTNCSFD